MNELDFSEIAKLSEKYNKDPRSRIFVQLADCYRKNNMVDEALDVLNKGLEHHPQYPLAHLVLGKCYFDKRAYIQARDAFEKTIALDPNNIVALRMLAKTCEILKDEKGQISAYKNIVGIDPLDTNAKEKLTMLEALQRKEPLYTVAMAEEYEKQGNLEESLKIYENLLYTDPSDLMLKQKVTELKNTISEKKIQIEGEKIEELQVEPVFKASDLPEGGMTEPEKTVASEEPKQQEEGIQSLEDFLVEELEQAAEKVAAQETAEPPAADEAKPAVQEVTAPEPTPLHEDLQKVAEPLEEKVAPPPLEEQDDTDKAVEMSFGDIMLEKDSPEKEPVLFEEEIRPSVPEVEEAKPQETFESQPTTPAEPLAEEKIELPTQETAPPEESEEPKKPKEEDYKSFQEWLSGLLK